MDKLVSLGNMLNQQKAQASFSLSDIITTEDSVQHICQFLRENSTYQTVEFKGLKLEGNSLITLANIIPLLTNCSSLSLEWNNIGQFKTGLSAITSSIAQNSAIKIVDFRNNKIYANGVQCIASLISDTSSL